MVIVKDRIPIRSIKIKSAITKSNINSILLYFLSAFTLITPADSLGFKKIFLIIALLFNASTIIAGLSRNIYYFFASIVLPIIISGVSCFLDGKTNIIISSVYIFFYIPLVFVIKKYNINITQIIVHISNIMAAVIIVSAMLDFVGIISIYSNPLLMWLSKNSEAQISKSSYAMFYYVIFLKASPILLFNVVYYLREKKYLHSFVIFLAVLFTGTRANIFTCAVIIFVFVLFVEPRKWVKAIALLFFLLILIAVGPLLVEKIKLIFWAKSNGDSVRTDTIKYTIEAINSKWYYWITGMGIGSEFYTRSQSRVGLVSTSELSYLEYVRTCGVFLSAIVFYVLCKPLVKMYKFNKWAFLFYSAYLLQGAFEPFIFTSTGFYVLMIMYSLILIKDNKELGLCSKAPRFRE